MNRQNQLVIFSMDGRDYGIHLFSVERVVQAVEVTPLPNPPKNVIGIIDVQGSIIPVVNIRKIFALPKKETELSDQIIIAKSSRRLFAFIVDEVKGVIEHADKEAVGGEKIFPGINYTEEVLKMKNDMVLVHNLDKFLSLEEEEKLNEALSQKQG